MTANIVRIKTALSEEKEVHVLNDAADVANDYLANIIARGDDGELLAISHSEARTKEAALAFLNNYFGLMTRFMVALDEETE